MTVYSIKRRWLRRVFIVAVCPWLFLLCVVCVGLATLLEALVAVYEDVRDEVKELWRLQKEAWKS